MILQGDIHILKFKPNMGDALIFYPLADDTNKCHPKALHAGMPIESGEKMDR